MLKKYLNKDFDWEITTAKREHKKGRAKGGFLLGIKKNWKGKGSFTGIEVVEGLIKSKIVIGEENFHINIWSIYNKGNLEKMWQYIENDNYCEKEGLIIAGDFNIRIGEEGKCVDFDSPEEIRQRRSRDKIVGREGREFLEKIENKGWAILNGSTAGDEDGEYTFVGGMGNSVIDFAIVNEDVWKKTRSFRVEERVESDHMPICMELKTEEVNKLSEQGTITEAPTRLCDVWNEESIAVFEEATRTWKEVVNESINVENRWSEVKDLINKNITRKEIKIKKWKLGMRKWWDKECARSKRKVGNMLKKWRSGKGEKEEYQKARREWKELCEEKKRSKKEEEEAELREIKNENQVWKYFNKGRKIRETVENSIKEEEWVAYFRTLLEGSDTKKVGMKRTIPAEKLEVEKVDAMEILAAWKKLKKKKAPGVDGITNEVWMHGGNGLKSRMIDIIEKVWEGEAIPEDWKTAVIVPLHKKGDKENTNNYRGISLLSTAYKLYSEVILRRLEEEVEIGGMLPEGQAGFRRGRSTIDNIYILNHISQMAKLKRKKLYAVFVDLKAAFDTVDREVLWEILIELGISSYLVERIKGLYEETKVRIRTVEGLSKEF